jgi:hypothetical protein
MSSEHVTNAALEAIPNILVGCLGFLFLAAMVVTFFLRALDKIRRECRWGMKDPIAYCLKCGEPAPLVRFPKSARELLWSGWTCRLCGLELDRWGRPQEHQSPRARWAVLEKVKDAEQRGGRQGAPMPSEQVQERAGHVHPKDHAEQPGAGV